MCVSVRACLCQLDSVKVPWNDILRSGPVLSLVLTHFANNAVYYTLLSCLPVYFRFVLRFNVVVVRTRSILRRRRLASVS